MILRGVLCVFVRTFVPCIIGIISLVIASALLEISDAHATQCEVFGDDYEPIVGTDACFTHGGYIRTELVVNDPDNPETVTQNAEFNGRVRSDFKVLLKSELGTLGAFIRFQADYNPGIFSDVIAGPEGENFAVGLDAFVLSLDNKLASFRLGEIENAGAAFISNGFTDRGAESLDARSGLGFSIEREFFNTAVRVSINDPRESTSATPVSPNFGLGLARSVGPVDLGFGAALVNVDDFIAFTDKAIAVQIGAPLLREERASLGFGLGADVKYTRDGLKLFAGITYAKNASNDVVFSFSDGFDAVTLYSGVSKKLPYNITVNADLSYVTAVQKGFRQFNGFEAAVNAVWQARESLTVLAELGFDSVDNFGAGDGFFFNLEDENEFDFLLQVQHEF